MQRVLSSGVHGIPPAHMQSCIRLLTPLACVNQVRHSSRIVSIIFTEDVPHLAQKGELRTVKMAFARNTLFPRKLAVIASPEAIEDFAEFTAKIDTTVAERKKELKKMEKRLFKLETFQVPVKSTDPAGRQVTAEKIAATLLLYKGIRVEKDQITIDEPITSYKTPVPVTIKMTDRSHVLKIEMVNG